jgi:hypothetical protein
MDRRAFLSGLGVFVTGAVGGCSSGGEVPETAPSPPAGVREATPETRTMPAGAGGTDGELSTAIVAADPEGANAVVLVRQDVLATDDNDLVVAVGVRNDGASRATALVDVSLRTASEDIALDRYVDLPPGGETLVRFTPDFSRDAFEGMSVDIRAETPATPLARETDAESPSTQAGAGTDSATAPADLQDR